MHAIDTSAPRDSSSRKHVLGTFYPPVDFYIDTKLTLEILFQTNDLTLRFVIIFVMHYANLFLGVRNLQ